jgi:hypothetical protein
LLSKERSCRNKRCNEDASYISEEATPGKLPNSTSQLESGLKHFFPVPYPHGNNLFNPFAAALDQNDQHYYRKDAGDYSDHRYIVHVSSPFSMSEVLI